MVPAIAKRRIIGAIISLLAGSLAVYWGIESSRLSRSVEECRVAMPTQFAADLSRPGVLESPFAQSCQMSHGEAILLKTTDGSELSSSMLAGLKGKATVLAADGTSVMTADFPETIARDSSRVDQGLQLAFFHPFQIGVYTLRVEIIEPAPGLAGRSQEIFARYELCGLEGLPAALAAAIAIPAGIVALVVGGFTVVGLKRHGWRRASRPQ